MEISINKITDNFYEVRTSSGCLKSFADNFTATAFANGIVEGYNMAKMKLADKPNITGMWYD